MKEEKHATKEAFDTAAFAKFFPGPARWQAGPLLLVFGIPRDDRDGTKHAMNPGNETQAPIGGVSAHDPGTDAIEVQRPCQQEFGKRCIMGESRARAKRRAASPNRDR